jgi:hypothetical protein
MSGRAMCASDALWASITREGERLHRAGEVAAAMATAATELRARASRDGARGEGGVRSEAPSSSELPDYFIKKSPRKRSSKPRAVVVVDEHGN